VEADKSDKAAHASLTMALSKQGRYEDAARAKEVIPSPVCMKQHETT